MNTEAGRTEYQRNQPLEKPYSVARSGEPIGPLGEPKVCICIHESSPGGQTTIDDNVLACNVARSVRCQVDDSTNHLMS